MQKIKMIWEFRGPEALKTAEHHIIHLKEYVLAKDLKVGFTGIDEINTQHIRAYLVTNESDMQMVRTELKPHIGQLYEE